MNINLNDIDYLDEDDDLCKCLAPKKKYLTSNPNCWTCEKCKKFGMDYIDQDLIDEDDN